MHTLHSLLRLSSRQIVNLLVCELFVLLPLFYGSHFLDALHSRESCEVAGLPAPEISNVKFGEYLLHF